MLIIAAALVAAHAPACATTRLDQMIAQYAELQRRQDVAAIARLYGADGEVINPGRPPVRGETAVRAFISGFRGFEVTFNQLIADAITVHESVWQVTGHFHQVGRTPTGAAYDVTGHFLSRWRCSPEGWRVARMETSQ